MSKNIIFLLYEGRRKDPKTKYESCSKASNQYIPNFVRIGDDFVSKQLLDTQKIILLV